MPYKPSSAAFALALAAATALGSGATAQTAPPMDDSTMTRLTKNAPDPQVDYLDLTLDIDMPDPASRSFSAVETLAFKTLKLPLDRLVLNGVGMTIESATVGGDPVAFRHDGEIVTLTFAEPLAPETEHALVFKYNVSNPASGMHFAIPDEAYPDRPLHIHTQGQPEHNRHWVICHDYPNERMRTHMNVTVPAKYKVLANGVREGVEDAGNGMQTWRYSLKKPHVSYLMSLVIGEFDVADLEAWEDVVMEAWVPPGRAEDADRTFGRTLNMMEFYSDKLGRYPWSVYHQSVVYKFGSGGMENTTVTTLYQDAILNRREMVGSTLDGLIAHELAHQWFGDATTCKTWGHLWLNEGFATWLDAAWHEHYHGHDEYAYELFTTMRRVAGNDDVTANGGLIWPYYDNPRQTFRRRESNPYSKGCSVIHMMRERLKQQGGTDDDFWQILKNFQIKHGGSDVESDELRRELEDYTGRDWELFFQQWVVRPGSPDFDVSYTWNADAKTVVLTVEQTQPISAEYPAFTGPLPVTLVDQKGTATNHVIDIDGRRTMATISVVRENQLP
ncbi:MAG: M1 family aminopeptidase, partial [Planctomycetota bacterium]